MAQEYKITNKIITINTIKEVAEYIRGVYNKYYSLIEDDMKRNEDLLYKERSYEYRGSAPKLEYAIDYQGDKSLTERDYEWFVEGLKDTRNVKMIKIYFYTIFHESIPSESHFNTNNDYKHLSIYAYFYEDRVKVNVDGKELENEAHQVYDDIKNIIEKSKDRFDKTIKNRGIRMKCFYFSLGLIFSYIALLILFANMSKIPENIVSIINNYYILVAIHFAFSMIIGTIIGSFFMNKLYEDIIPARKYSHYSKSSQKFVYIDNIDDYISKDETQIGKFYNSLERRNKIESIYKYCRLIALAQISIYIICIALAVIK